MGYRCVQVMCTLQSTSFISCWKHMHRSANTNVNYQCGRFLLIARFVRWEVVLLQIREHTYKGHTDSVDQLCWHPSDPSLFVTASGDKTVRIWDWRSSKTVASISTKGTNVCLQMMSGYLKKHLNVLIFVSILVALHVQKRSLRL